MGVKNNEMKRAYFFSICGEPLYVLASGISHPRDLDEVEFPEIIQALTDHFKPLVNVVAAYHRFRHCNQKVDQPVNDFVAELRRLATNCNFKMIRNDMIMYQLVWGNRDEQVRSRLLQTSDLNLQQAIDIALRAESAHGVIEEITNENGAVCVVSQSTNLRDGTKQRVSEKPEAQSQPSSSQNFTCFRCAGNHKVTQCRLDPNSLICTACNKQGHVTKICQDLVRSLSQNQVNQSNFRTIKIVLFVLAHEESAS